jgi:predicted  nucleic acid-binding Zn-ribbon protein
VPFIPSCFRISSLDFFPALASTRFPCYTTVFPRTIEELFMSGTVTLPALLALFKIDRDLQQLHNGLETAQKDQKNQQTKIAALQKDLDAQQAALQKLQADVAAKELDMKTRQEHIEKMRASLNSTKTNKEYSAILVQISAEKAEVAKIESATLEQMAQVETASKSVAALKEAIASETQLLAKIQAEHGDKVTMLTDQINALAKRRAEAAAAVPTEALRQYDRVNQKFPGDAMAPLVYDENSLEDISCGSCYMGLNVEHLNALRGRDAIRRCNSCNRILYLPEMLQPTT